ncbi:hypothetical protein HBI56_202940 [Parastagonospora nodorum]|nr:hypothetical protein HBH56_143140 [Parastagonospora nodorum]KAH3927779.1 hypothetical protein HBH54_148330 [Parastagonospora nodorum]KAH3947784.1 hypothetical protein HBH53_108370 [Parastagonospora nodorum]KAH3961987.1 hypothetical protein HBH51_178650 [Parastagonospora nodorum]KAH3971081.1 hypothetical protein HBH52_163150 [Parastagonospora nodorum]
MNSGVHKCSSNEHSSSLMLFCAPEKHTSFPEAGLQKSRKHHAKQKNVPSNLFTFAPQAYAEEKGVSRRRNDSS